MTSNPPDGAHERTEVKHRGYGIEATKAWSVFLGRSLAQVFAVSLAAFLTAWAGVETYDELAAHWWTDSIDFTVGEPMESADYAVQAPSSKPEIVERSFPNYGDMARLDGALAAREIVSEHKWLRVLLGAGAILAAHVLLMRMKSWMDA